MTLKTLWEMEKEVYETYEYLPASGSNTEVEPYQFFVVQDDGTFLINRQLQYVTQVQDVKEPLEGEQASTMLDMAPQQFFVDMDSSTEMIVADQFNIPEGTSNLYTGSYLLQPGTAAPVEQIAKNVTEQPKLNLQAEDSLPESNKQTNSLTEITLTDEQYQMLEQKGWILLESNEKVYVLDTLGLHDITTNDKLIQKLKVQETTSSLEPESGQLKIEFSSSLGAIAVEVPNDEHNKLKSQLPSDLECMGKVSITEKETKETHKKPELDKEKVLADEDIMLKPTQVDNLHKGVYDQWKDDKDKVIRIRTDVCLKDIPDKIILGKTKNGKRLVCKVIKPNNDTVKPITKGAPEIDPVPSSETVQKSHTSEIDPVQSSETVQKSNTSDFTDDVGDDKLDSIFRKCFEESTAQYCIDDVTAAAHVIKQLLRLPAVKPAIANRNMLVTKVSVNEIDSMIEESSPTLVTGKVHLVNKEWRFLCHPELYEIAKKELSVSPSENSTDHNFLHMHMQEIKKYDKHVRTAITLNIRRLEISGKRHPEKIFIPDLPLDVKPEPTNVAPVVEAENTMYGYACGTCAAIFRDEKELNSHKESHRMDTDNKLTIDTEEPILKPTGILCLHDPCKKERTYSCVQCNAKFRRLNNCQRHVRTHVVPAHEASGGKSAYKCKICHTMFHHAPTLVKHIMTRHIKIEK